MPKLHLRFSLQRLALPGADDGDGPAVVQGHAAQDRGVLAAEAVALLLKEVGEQRLDIVGDIGPLGVAGNGHPRRGGQRFAHVRPPFLVEPQQLGQGVPHLQPGHHRVHKAVFFLELRPLEALRQGLADGLLDDPGTGKADQGTGLRQNDVPQGGKAGRDPAGGGVCQDRDIQQALFREAGQRRAGLGHLHQGEDALLHPGAAAGGKEDQGQAVLGGVFDGQGDLLSHRRAHGAHEEAAVQHPHHTFVAADGAGGSDGGLREAGLALGGLHLFPIAGEGEGGRRGRAFQTAPGRSRGPGSC